MTNTEKQALKLLIRREIHNRSFYEFVKWIAVLLEPSTNWKWNFHHEYICNQLQSEIERISEGGKRDKHISINVPFRSSKSHIVSICLPLWSWTINPNLTFINLSYSDSLATSHSNKVFSIIHNHKFNELYPEIQLDDVQRSKTDFKLKGYSGSRISGGMTGTVLGKGADVIVIDDGNNTRRLSEVERKNTIDSWKDTVSTRLNDPYTGLFINVQQRLHDNDLTGYLIKNETDDWQHICLPAELTSNVQPAYLAEFYVDGLLWKERFSFEVLNNFKNRLGSRGYANQLNQETAPSEGNIIKRKWIPIIPYETLEAKLFVSQSNLTGNKRFKKLQWEMFIDSAYTKDSKNDPSAILIVCKFEGSVYVRKVFELWLEFPDLIKKIRELYQTYCSNNGRIYVEPKASGKDIVNTLKKDVNAIELPPPKDDKETRLNAVSPSIEAGRLILIEDTSNERLIKQITKFPNAEHDDITDVVVHALNKYLGKSTDFNYAML